MNNMEFWERVKKTDPSRVKPITGKQYKGNSPQPYYLVERLTGEFGMCGCGWGFVIDSERMERLTETDVLHVAVITLWYEKDGKRCEIQQVGQTKAVYKSAKSGIIVDEDAPKKSVTDALVKCASYLGFAGDIFSGAWDDSKYVADLKEEFAGKQGAQADAAQYKEDIAEAKKQMDDCATEDSLKAVFASWWKYFEHNETGRNDVKSHYDAIKPQIKEAA